MDLRAGGTFKLLYALATFLLSEPAKWRLDVKAGVRATEYDEIIHAALCPKIAFLKNNN
jgi:hypothetical protein